MSEAMEQAIKSAEMLRDMRALKGTKTDFDVQKMEHLRQSMGSTVTKNKDILQKMEAMIRRTTDPQPMSKTEMQLGISTGHGKEQIEAEAIERSYDTIGTGGRIEEYANGALEWVPNGPGDVPQPPTGDTFFDPIRDEQRQVDRSDQRRETLRNLSSADRKWLEQQMGRPIKFARGGLVKNFQAGGLAAVTDFEEEDEFDSPELMEPMVADIVARTTDPGPESDLRGMLLKGKEDAMARLKEGRTRISERRAASEKEQERNKWLSFAQGMLAPTTTGSFGESVGQAAEQLRDSSLIRSKLNQDFDAQEGEMDEREYAITSDYMDSLTNLEGFKQTSRARVVGTTIVTDPADQAKVDAGLMLESEARRRYVSTIMLPNGETISRVEEDADGNAFSVVDPRKVPSQAAAQTTATSTAAAASKDNFLVAKRGMDAIPMVTRLQRAYSTLQNLTNDTSGLSEKMREVAQWAGISEVIDDNVDLAKLQKMFGAQILQDLRLLTGSKTDFEYMKVEGQNARLGASVEENLGILDEHMFMLNELVDKGEFAAQNISQGPGTGEKNFMLQQYLRHRRSQADAALEYDAVTRKAPATKVDELIKLHRRSDGNAEEQQFLIDSFTEFYDIPDDAKLKLRKQGANL